MLSKTKQKSKVNYLSVSDLRSLKSCEIENEKKQSPNQNGIVRTQLTNVLPDVNIISSDTSIQGFNKPTFTNTKNPVRPNRAEFSNEVCMSQLLAPAPSLSQTEQLRLHTQKSWLTTRTADVTLLALRSMTDNQRKSFRALFELLDPYNNGQISLSQLAKLLQYLGTDMTLAKLLRATKRTYVCKEQYLNFVQFCELLLQSNLKIRMKPNSKSELLRLKILREESIIALKNNISQDNSNDICTKKLSKSDEKHNENINQILFKIAETEEAIEQIKQEQKQNPFLVSYLKQKRRRQKKIANFKQAIFVVNKFKQSLKHSKRPNSSTNAKKTIKLYDKMTNHRQKNNCHSSQSLTNSPGTELKIKKFITWHKKYTKLKLEQSNQDPKKHNFLENDVRSESLSSSTVSTSNLFESSLLSRSNSVSQLNNKTMPSVRRTSSLISMPNSPEKMLVRMLSMEKNIATADDGSTSYDSSRSWYAHRPRYSKRRNDERTQQYSITIASFIETWHRRRLIDELQSNEYLCPDTIQVTRKYILDHDKNSSLKNVTVNELSPTKISSKIFKESIQDSMQLTTTRAKLENTLNNIIDVAEFQINTNDNSNAPKIPKMFTFDNIPNIVATPQTKQNQTNNSNNNIENDLPASYFFTPQTLSNTMSVLNHRYHNENNLSTAYTLSTKKNIQNKIKSRAQKKSNKYISSLILQSNSFINKKYNDNNNINQSKYQSPNKQNENNNLLSNRDAIPMRLQKCVSSPTLNR